MSGVWRHLNLYLDSDDALNIHFVEDIQKHAESLRDSMFITYTDGYHLYIDHHYAMRIRYSRHHFASVIENND